MKRVLNFEKFHFTTCYMFCYDDVTKIAWWRAKREYTD